MVAKAAVEAAGWKKRQAENGAEALEQLAQHPADAVLMDVQMPVMTGDESIRRIRASDEAWSQVPIVVLTANASPTGAEDCEAWGANAYLTKPLACASSKGRSAHFSIKRCRVQVRQLLSRLPLTNSPQLFSQRKREL